MKQHPQVKCTLILTPGPIQLSRFELDLIIRIKSTEDDHRTRPLLKVPYAICASPVYLEGHPSITSAYGLASHNCLIHSTQETPDCWSIVDGGSETEVRVSGNFESNNSLAVRSLALAGEGVARLPTYLVSDDFRQGNLVNLFTDRVVSRRVLSGYYPRSNRVPPKVDALLDFLAANLRVPEIKY
jgi:DNA-binding transcriptional LysR family regulator